MTKYISNAQNFEDIYLFRAYSLVKSMFGSQVNAKEIIVDIGAWEPVADNVSCFFIQIGWKAVLIEPQVHYYQKLVDHYKHDLGVKVIHAAISHQRGTASFFVPEVTTGWGSLQENHASQMKESNRREIVTLMTLDDVHINLGTNYLILKVDAEESERSILEGWLLDQVSPVLICIEDQDEQVLSILNTRKYRKFFFDGINAYFVKEFYYKALEQFNPINLLEDSQFKLREGTWLINSE